MRIIYKSKKYDPENRLYGIECGRTAFVPVFDSTDHLHFACIQCKEIATILQVKRDDAYANTPTIYFLMQCPKCGKCSVKKIYLEDAGKHFMVYPVSTKLLAETPDETKPGLHKRK